MAGGDDGLHTVNAAGELTGEYETPWNEFLIHLHYYLNLPTSFGMIVVAIFGVMLVAMAVSGFLAHPRIFRDAFRLRRRGQPRLVQADLHNRLSVWTAPFTIIVAATGAIIGLFSIVAIVLAQTSFDGDRTALSQAIFGAEHPVDETPADLADVGGALASMDTAAAEANPFLVIVHDPLTAGQHTAIYGEHHDRLIYGETYEFNAAGAFTGTGGYSDGEAGQQIAMSTYYLHFGDFGGLPVKIAYFVFGIALCTIIAAGMNIYFLKRAEAGRAMPGLASAWSALVWGTPALLALTLLASLFGVQGSWLVALYWAGSLGVCAYGWKAGDAISTGKHLRRLLGVSLGAAVIAHAVMYPGSYSNIHISVTSLALTLGAVLFILQPTAIAQRPKQVEV